MLKVTVRDWSVRGSAEAAEHVLLAFLLAGTCWNKDISKTCFSGHRISGSHRAP